MKKGIVVLLALFVVGSLCAQMTFGVNGELAMPMGDFGDIVGMGFGGTVQGEYPINETIVATASAGYLMWNGKDAFEDWSYSCIPIKAGAKYHFGDMGLYGIFELGMYMFTIEWEFLGATLDDSESEFGFAPGIGYQMPMGEKMKLDISAQYEIAGDIDFLGIDIGVRF